MCDFCRAVDDSVDLKPTRTRAAAALARWRAELGALLRRRAARDAAGTRAAAVRRAVPPAARAVRGAHRRRGDGRRRGRYATFAELEPYCHRVASAVGLICAEIFGYRDAGVRDYARDLGVALQLTNILRDVAVDYRARPAATCRSRISRASAAPRTTCGARSSRPDAACGRPRSAPCSSIQAARARVYFARARCARCRRTDARRFVAAEIMRAIYRELLHRIERADYDVFTRRHPRAAARRRRDWPRQGLVAAPPGCRRAARMDRCPPTSSSSAPAFAGLAAATALADAGRRVVVARGAPRARRPRDGVRRSRDAASASTTASTCCSAATTRRYAFLRRIGADGLAPLQPTLATRHMADDGRTAASVLRCPRLPPPLHLLAGVLRGARCRWRDRLRRCGWRACSGACGVRGAAVVAGAVTAARRSRPGWTAHGQSRALREWLWDPLAVAALNQSPGRRRGGAVRARARRAVRPATRGRRDWSCPRVPLTSCTRCRRAAFVEAHAGGARPDRRSARVALDESGRVAGVDVEATTIDARAVVGAVPWHALGRAVARRRARRRDGADRRRRASAMAVVADRHGQPLVRRRR